MSSEEESSPPREPNARSCPGAPRKKEKRPLRNRLGIAPRKLFGDSLEDDEKTLGAKHAYKTIVSSDGHMKQPESHLSK